MPTEPPPPREWLETPSQEQSFNCSLTVVETGANFARIPLRTHAGIRQPGMPGAFAFVLLMAWAAFSGSVACQWFFLFWCVMAVVHWLSRDEEQDSTYPGWTRGLGGRLSDRAACAVEAAAVLTLGFVLYHVEPPLGVLLLFSGACLGLSECLVRLILRRRRIAIRDAMKRARMHAAEFQRERGW